jgi:SlyX protein
MTDTRIDRIEEQLAHVARAVEEVSDVLHAQADRLDRLERQLAQLVEREAEREAAGAVTLGDQRPPHW